MLNVILQIWSEVVAEPGLVVVALAALIIVSTTLAGVWMVVNMIWHGWKESE